MMRVETTIMRKLPGEGTITITAKAERVHEKLGYLVIGYRHMAILTLGHVEHGEIHLSPDHDEDIYYDDRPWKAFERALIDMYDFIVAEINDATYDGEDLQMVCRWAEQLEFTEVIG